MKTFLADLTNPKNTLGTVTRFNVAYDTAFGFLQVALRMKGYRTTTAPGHRAVLFETLPVLVPGAAGSQEALSYAHGLRNKLEYDMFTEVPTSMVDDMVVHVKSVGEEVDYAFKKFKAAKQPPPAPSPPAPPAEASRARTPGAKKKR